MKALTYYGRGGNGRGDFRVEDVPEPTVVPGTVKIDVEWCGICGSDLHEFEADTVSGYSPPVILGHEFAGREHGPTRPRVSGRMRSSTPAPPMWWRQSWS